MSRGYSAGSYSRSASWMIAMSPLTCGTAALTAAPLPWLCAWKTSTRRFAGVSGVAARSSSSTTRVPSVEQSSTTMISFGMGTAMTRSRRVRTVPTSLYTGTITDRRGRSIERDSRKPRGSLQGCAPRVDFAATRCDTRPPAAATGRLPLLAETFRDCSPGRTNSPGRAFPILLVLALGLAGCVDFDASLNEDGSGTFTLQCTAPNPRFDLPRFFSPHVRIQSVNRTGAAISLKGTFDDITQLPTAEFFRPFTIRREHLGGQERLRVLYRNPKLECVPEAQRGVWVVNLGVDLPAP